MPQANSVVSSLLSDAFGAAIEKQNRYELSFFNMIASDNARARRSLDGRFAYEGEMIQEGLVFKRPFAGAAFHDEIEDYAAKIACAVFGAEHANLQPHSCSQANQAAYFGLLNPGDAVLALDFKAGGHLTHGKNFNFSGRTYNFHYYGTDSEGLIDYDQARSRARTLRPKIILCGSSSYPRDYDYTTLREIADDVGAYLMCDVAHEAGLVAAGEMRNPVLVADVVTMSMEKTMRGVSSGLILCKKELATKIDRGVHPGTQSSFPIRRLVESGTTLLETQTSEFKDYARRVRAIADKLASDLMSSGVSLVTGGTDKHLLVLETARSAGLSGAQAERRLESIGVLSNRQMVPSDNTEKFSEGGGLRLGTAWASSRGFEVSDFSVVSELIVETLFGDGNEKQLARARDGVSSLLAQRRSKDVLEGCQHK